MDKREKKIDSKLVYDGAMLHVFRDGVLCPSGSESSREYIRHCGAAAILAFDENDNVILESQFRYPFDAEMIEIPAGKRDPGEEPYECAMRELEEETGYVAGELIYLGCIRPTAAYSDEVIYLYEAHNLKKGVQHLDQDEALDFYFEPFEDLLTDLYNGKVCDGKTQAAVLLHLLNGRNKK